MNKAIVSSSVVMVNPFDNFKRRVLSFVETANKKNGANINPQACRFWIDEDTKGNSYKALVCGIKFASNPQTCKILVKFNGHSAII